MRTLANERWWQWTLVLCVYGINKSKQRVCIFVWMWIWVFEHVGMSYSERTKETEKTIFCGFWSCLQEWIYCSANINMSRPTGKHICFMGKMPWFSYWKLHFWFRKQEELRNIKGKETRTEHSEHFMSRGTTPNRTTKPAEKNITASALTKSTR